MILLQHGKTLAGGDDNISVGGLQGTGKNLQKCGFTGAVGTDQTITVALCKFNVDIFKQGLLPTR